MTNTPLLSFFAIISIKRKALTQNIKKTINFLLYLLLIGTALPFLLSFLNFLHPLFDSISHFRVHLLILLLPILLLVTFFHEKRRYAYAYLVLLVLGGFYLYNIIQPFEAPKTTDKEKIHTLKHLQFNLNFKNKKMEELKIYLKENAFDVVTLQEVTPLQQESLEMMKSKFYDIEFSDTYPYIGKKEGAYPYQKYCDFQSVGGVAILSKYPFNEEQSVCLEGKGLLWSQINKNNKAINIVSIHLYWPFPYHQPQQVETITQIFQHIQAPLLIAGDFNAAAWSHTVKTFEKTSNTKAVEGMRWSINLEKQVPLIPNFKLAIDHVLLSEDFQVKSIKVAKGLGSDHLPIVSEIAY